MNSYCVLLSRLVSDESGQDLIEYALISALLGLAAITAMKGVGTSIHNAFTGISSTLNSAI